MLQDPLFTEETTPDDLVMAQALLARRSPEDIAAALARLYRARLPSPEDIIDPGEERGRFRDNSARDNARPSRGDDRPSERRPKPGKSSAKHGMGEPSVWFRAAIGRKKNAEARWLLPMICRRGGIDKNDIGAIRIMDTTTEFEISERVAESFAAKVKRPDKEDNIRIEPLGDRAQGEAPSEKKSRAPRREADDEIDHAPRRNEHSRDARGPKPHGKHRGDGGAKFVKEAGFGKKKDRNKSGHGGQPHRANTPGAKDFRGKKPKKNRRG